MLSMQRRILTKLVKTEGPHFIDKSAILKVFKLRTPISQVWEMVKGRKCPVLTRRCSLERRWRKQALMFGAEFSVLALTATHDRAKVLVTAKFFCSI